MTPDPTTTTTTARQRQLLHPRAARGLRREWPALALEYRSKLSEVTSPEAWDETFRPWTDPAREKGTLDD